MKKTVLYFAALICMMMQTVPTFASDRVDSLCWFADCEDRQGALRI